MSKSSAAKRGVGFTLIELLVAIAVFSVLAVFAYQGLRNFIVARARVTEHSEAFARVVTGVTMLQQDLENIAPRPIRDALGGPEPALAGATGVQPAIALTRHTAWAPLDDATPDLKRVEYRLQDGHLIRRTWAVLDRVPDSAFADRVVLDDVTAISFRFFDDGEWHDAWPRVRGAAQIANLPRAVSAQLVFANGRVIDRLFLLPGAG